MLELQRFHSRHFPGGHPVARDARGPVTWDQLLADVSATRRALEARGDHRDWALFDDDAYRFSVGLLALLADGRRAILPGDLGGSTLAALRDRGARLLGDVPGGDALAIVTGAEPPGVITGLGGELVIFTSGSTGAPKAIAKSLRQLDAELAGLEQQWGERIGDARFVGGVSHQHFYGLLFRVLWPLCSGRCFWRRAYLDPAVMARDLLAQADHPGTAWISSPAQLHRLENSLPWSELRRQLVAVFSSGGPLKREPALDIHRHLGHGPLEVLGSSETGGIAWREQGAGGDTWQALPGVACRVGEDGALAVRSPMLADDSWHSTADSAQMLGDGRFTLGERLDRIVKLEGRRVSLPQVEGILAAHPWIDEGAAVAHPGRRQALAALIVLTEQGRDALAREGLHHFGRQLRRFLLSELPAAAVPRTLRPVAELPRNAQGKIQQRSLATALARSPLPYLVQRTIDGSEARLSLYVPADNAYFRGHFPESPVLPGVAQIHWADHFGRDLFGVEGEPGDMKAVKFQALARPDTLLELQLHYDGGKRLLRFQFQSAAGQHSQGRLYYGAPA